MDDIEQDVQLIATHYNAHDPGCALLAALCSVQ
jgi:hypothetical protein